MTRRSLLLTLCLLVAACGDDAPANDDMSVSIPRNFKQINAAILGPSCANFKSCHSFSGKTDSKLNLCSAPDAPGASVQVCQPTATLLDAYQALIDKIPANARAKSEGMKLVDPCKPANSFILTKLRLPVTETDPKVSYGQHMPKDNPSLPKTDIDAISDWIARGAHFDEPDNVSGVECVMSPPDLSVVD